MSKSRGNVVNPDDIVRDYGADAFRLYEMYMGPSGKRRSRGARGTSSACRDSSAACIAISSVTTNRARLPAIVPESIPDALERLMHRTIKKVGSDIEALRFNTAIAELIKTEQRADRLDDDPPARWLRTSH